MWVLLISLYLHQPLGQTQSKGVLQAPFESYERCVAERERVRRDWHLGEYRVSPRCVYVKYYSRDNGAYNETNR